MSPDRIRQLLTTKPFEPFAIHTGDGSRVEVLSPELTLLYPGGWTLRVLTPRVQNARREGQFEEHVIDVFLIAKVTSPVDSVETGAI